MKYDIYNEVTVKKQENEKIVWFIIIVFLVIGLSLGTAIFVKKHKIAKNNETKEGNEKLDITKVEDNNKVDSKIKVQTNKNMTEFKKEITKQGTGAGAVNGNTVSMIYTGKFLDGKVFDSNTSANPFSFVLGSGQVIQGWEKGVLGMKVGEKATLSIPYSMAYGESGYGPIPAKSDLIFDVEVVEIK